MRRPSLKSSLYMALLAAGIVGTGILIFRGVGAPHEPARAVVPGDVFKLRLDEPGTYVIIAEQVIAPRSVEMQELVAPQVEIKLRRTGPGKPRGGVIIRKPGLAAWFYKVLTRRRGHNLGQFTIERGGRFHLRGLPSPDDPTAVNRSIVLAFARTTSPGRFLWLLLGFGGQICFSLRFIIQWLASEKAGRSTVPRAFWYYSLVGGLMILAYAIYTRDPVFMMAYAFNAFIYVRNLVLIRREDRALARAAAGAEAGK